MAVRAPRPTFARERAAWADEHLLVGVDEAGRGPLAGPVVAAAVVFFPGQPLRGLRDSKTLSAEKREELAVRIRERSMAVGVGAASTREIDRLNIRVATALAMRRAIERAHVALIDRERARVLIDGLPMPEIGYTHDALVDGDALCPSIAAASIVAKTVRDLLMHRLARRYPSYGWETNVGYGTPQHQAGLREHGPCRHHRQSFAPIAQLTFAL